MGTIDGDKAFVIACHGSTGTSPGYGDANSISSCEVGKVVFPRVAVVIGTSR